MPFDAREELVRLSHQVQVAYDDYVKALATAETLKDTLEAPQRLDTAFGDLRTCWEQKGVEEEIQKLTGYAPPESLFERLNRQPAPTHAIGRSCVRTHRPRQQRKQHRSRQRPGSGQR